MTIEQKIKKLKSGQIPNLLLVQGEDNYLNEKVEQALLSGSFGHQIDDFSFGRYDMEDHLIDEALAEAQSMPLFSDFRLIFIENPYFLSTQRVKNQLDHDIDWLLEYIQSPSDFTRFVIFANYESLDMRKKINKKLKEHAQWISTAPLTDQDNRRYIQKILQQEGYQIENEALDTFIDLSGQNLNQMVNEINKMMTYKAEDQLIKEEDVKKLISPTLTQDIFSLNEAILKQDVQQSLTIFRDLLLQKEAPLKLMSILLGQFRLLLQIKILRQKGYLENDMTKLLKVHPYRIKLALKSENYYSQKHLELAIKQLIEADYRIKTGQMDDWQQFELFIIHYCGQKIS